MYSIYFNFQCILLSTWAPCVAFDPEFVLVSLLIASGALAGGEAGGIRQIEYRALIYLISAPPPSSLPETEYEKNHWSFDLLNRHHPPPPPPPPSAQKIRDLTQRGREHRRECYKTIHLITKYNDFTWECNQLATFPSAGVFCRMQNGLYDSQRTLSGSLFLCRKKDFHTMEYEGCSFCWYYFCSNKSSEEKMHHFKTHQPVWNTPFPIYFAENDAFSLRSYRKTRANFGHIISHLSTFPKLDIVSKNM